MVIEAEFEFVTLIEAVIECVRAIEPVIRLTDCDIDNGIVPEALHDSFFDSESV